MTTAPARPTPTYLEATLAAAGEKRELVGLAVPYGEVTERADWLRGTSNFRIDHAEVLDGAQLFYGHDHLGNGLPIGLITSSEDTDAGLKITARVSETPKGDEVLTLVKDGVLTKFSIGFLDDQWHVEEDDSLLVHDNVSVFETSVVPRPQYDSAVIEAVLHRPTRPTHTQQENPTMTETAVVTHDDIATLSSSIEQLERQIATLGGADAGDSAPHVPGASYGEFLQALSRGDQDATEFLAYVGGVVGDLGDWVKDSWVGDITRIVDKPRHCINFFEQGPLPESGMGVEFGKLLADTTDVAKQAAEGDVLPYGKITFTTDRASIDTYGGWGEMSRQEVERSSIQIVDKFFAALIRQYAIATEAAVRTMVQNATGAHSVAATDLTTADGWITFLVEASAYLDDKGLAPEAVFVSKDVFVDLATLRDGDAMDAPRLLNRSSGQISVTGLTGDVFNVPIRMLGNLTANTVRVADSAAIKTFESSGAPFRLQDDDITNLTKAFSCYGYLAVADQEPDAIVVPGV